MVGPRAGRRRPSGTAKRDPGSGCQLFFLSPSDGAAGRDEVVLKGPGKDPLPAAPRLRHTPPCSLDVSVLLTITRSRIRPQWERGTTKHTKDTKKGKPAC